MTNGQSKALPPASPLLSEGDVIGKGEQEHRIPRFAELDAMINADNHANRRRKEPARKRRLPAVPSVHEEVAACVAPRPAPKRADLDGVVSQFAANLCRDFADEITADPKGFKKQATHYLKQYLPPFAGRPSETSITQAINLSKAGRPWCEIYPQVILDHSTMDDAVRRQAESNLRAAVRSRRNAAKRRKRPNHSIAEVTPSPNVPLDKNCLPASHWGRNEAAHSLTDRGAETSGCSFH